VAGLNVLRVLRAAERVSRETAASAPRPAR